LGFHFINGSFERLTPHQRNHFIAPFGQKILTFY